MEAGPLVSFAFYVCLAIALFLLVEFAYLSIIAPFKRRRSINRRLGAHLARKNVEQALTILKSERGLLDRELPFMRGLQKLIVQSGLRMTVRRFLALTVLLAAGIASVLLLFTGLPHWAAIAIAVAAGAFIPVQVLLFYRKRRQQMFLAQLPDALDTLVRSLKSGHPIQTAMLFVGREMPDPIGTEFGMTVDEITYGLGLQTALQNLSGRVGVSELAFLVATTSLQGKTGGNLAEVLDNLSRLIRERFQVRRKARSMSAEGRWSASALVVMPALIAAVIHFQNPGYYGDVWQEPKFRAIITALAVWQVIGFLIMRKMVNFRF
jgi:tight adherence protein B